MQVAITTRKRCNSSLSFSREEAKNVHNRLEQQALPFSVLAPSRLATTRFLRFFWLRNLERILGHVVKILHSAGHDQLPGNVREHFLNALTRFTRSAVDATDEVVALFAKGLDVCLGDVDAAHQVNLVSAEEDLGILGIAYNVQQVLGQDVERVGIVQAKHQHSCLGELVVAGCDGRHTLHAPGVPELQLQSFRS